LWLLVEAEVVIVVVVVEALVGFALEQVFL
jgi:hypothetical protein